MKKFACAALAAFFAVVGFATAASHVVDHPQAKVGDFWEYQMFNDWNGNVIGENTMTISEISEKGVEFVRTSEKGVTTKVVETPDMNTIVSGSRRFSPDSGLLVFPLSVGATWQSKADFVIDGSRRGSYDLTATVVGWEEIEVPAGKFMALKIVWKGHYRTTMSSGASGTGKQEQAVWYAPAVKRAVLVTYQDTKWDGSPYTRETYKLRSFKVN